MTKINRLALSTAAGLPRDLYAYLPAEAERSLDSLVKEGLVVPAAPPLAGEKVKVRFEAQGEPRKARPGTGWLEVKVKASTGPTSTLQVDGLGVVSGLVRLR